MTEVVQIDDLKVEVRRSPRRRTVDLTVDRFGDLVISVPESLPDQEVRSIVRRKQEWICAKLGQKNVALRPRSPREYVTGEGFYYLGRKYRLKLFDPRDHEDVAPLRLLNGRFWMIRSCAPQGRELFIRWYTRQGQAWMADAIKALSERVLAAPRSITLRDLKFRWGSCNAHGDMYFHWRVMLLPPPVIRYLLLHELVHLREHHHGPAFYERLGRAAPDLRETEEWLEKNAAMYRL